MCGRVDRVGIVLVGTVRGTGCTKRLLAFDGLELGAHDELGEPATQMSENSGEDIMACDGQAVP